LSWEGVGTTVRAGAAARTTVFVPPSSVSLATPNETNAATTAVTTNNRPVRAGPGRTNESGGGGGSGRGGASIGGVKVKLDTGQEATTDDQGHFEFVLPQTSSDPAANSADEYAIGAARISMAFALNYPLMARKPAFLNPDNRFGTQPQLFTGNELTLILVPEALIVGRVTLGSSNQADRVLALKYLEDWLKKKP